MTRGEHSLLDSAFDELRYAQTQLSVALYGTEEFADLRKAEEAVKQALRNIEDVRESMNDARRRDG